MLRVPMMLLHGGLLQGQSGRLGAGVHRLHLRATLVVCQAARQVWVLQERRHRCPRFHLWPALLHANGLVNVTPPACAGQR
jgi:hypothetical protein